MEKARLFFTQGIIYVLLGDTYQAIADDLASLRHANRLIRKVERFCFARVPRVSAKLFSGAGKV
jgi:hypothetical protein